MSAEPIAERQATPAELAALRPRILAALVACHALNDFYQLVIPIMLPAIRASFGLDYTAVSIVPFLYQATSAVFQPTLGYVADRRRLRQAVMASGFAGFSLAMVGLWLSRDYLGLLITAVVLGLAMSCYHPQSATMLAYFFSRERRGFAQGVHGIGNAIGFVAAPVVVGFLLGRFEWHTVALWLAVPALIALVIALVALREPLTRGSKGMFAGINRPLILLTVVTGLGLATSGGFSNWLPSYYVAHGFSLSSSALLTALMSGAAIVAQPLGGGLSDRFGRRNLLAMALAGSAISLALFLLAPSIGWAIGLSVLFGFWASLTPPVALVYASELAPGGRTGTAVGVVWGLGTLVSSLILPLTGHVIDLAGGQIAPAYLILVVVAVVAAALARRLPRA